MTEISKKNLGIFEKNDFFRKSVFFSLKTLKRRDFNNFKEFKRSDNSFKSQSQFMHQ